MRLPAGGDGCVVARVGAVPERRRALVAQLSVASSVAWAPGAPVVAYAETSQRRPSGRSVRALLRVSDPNQARRWLVERAPVRVVFGSDARCEEGWRCWRARTEGSVIALELGPWDSSLPGVERACGDAVRRAPDALEVARVAVESPFHAELSGPRYLVGVVELVPSEHGLRWRRRMFRPRTLPPQEFEWFVDLQSEMERERIVASRSVRRWQRGDTHHTEIDYVWEDLELAREDRRRMREALAEEAREELPLPVESVDVSDVRALWHQVALHRRRMERGSEGARMGHALQLRQLLMRAHEAFPEDEELARALVRVLLEELNDGEAAVSVATAMLGAGVSDASSWRLLRRRAMAAVGVESLTGALIEDGVVGRRAAPRAAGALVHFREDYELAEAAWIAAQESRGLARRMRRVGSARLPVASLVDTLVVLADPDGPAKSIHAFLRLEAELEPSAAGTPEARVLTWVDRGGTWRAGAERLDGPDHLRGLGRGLFRELPDGAEMELLVAAVPFDGRLDEPAGAVRVAGRLLEGDFVVTRASVGLDWEAVAHWLAGPFEQLQPRLFPPPEFAIEASDAAEAQALTERASREPVLRCRAEGSLVRCGGSPQLDATRRAWRRVVWPKLEGQAIRKP